jgi:hypothetical protein
MTRDEYELPGGMRLEVRNNTTYNVERCVSLKASDPEHPDNATFEVMVTGSVGSYKPEPTTPRLQLPSHLASFGCTHKQWELIKQIADQAWSEYEKRFPTGG